MDASPSAPPRTLKDVFDEITATEFSWRQRFYHIIHGQPVISPDDYLSRSIHVLVILCVIASTTAFVVETLPQFYDPNGTSGAFFTLEIVFVSIFTADILLRIAAAVSIWNVVNIQGLFDVLSVAGFYAGLIVDAVGGQSGIAVLQILRILRLSRVLRLLKLSRSGNGVVVITKTLQKSEQGLVLLVFLVTISVVLWSGIFFYAEIQYLTWNDATNTWLMGNGKASPFQSVPACFWFIIVTLTTIGSVGDNEVPSNWFSKSVAIIAMYSGIILIAFPTMLIGGNFQIIHSQWKRQRARTALGRKFRFVRYVVRFIRIWRNFKKHGDVGLLRVDSSYNISAAFARRSLVLNDDPEISDVSIVRKGNRRNVNFFFKAVDFSEFNFEASAEVLNAGHLDEFCVNDLPASEVMLRLVKVFSCCATVEELYESFRLEPYARFRPKQFDLSESMCHLANAGLIELFVLNRVDDSMVALVTKKGLITTSHCVEYSTLVCRRSLTQAKEIWERTTGAPTPSLLPIDGFREWQEEQRTVPRHGVGFCADLKSPEARNNNVFRGLETTSESFDKSSCVACLHCSLNSLSMEKDCKSFLQIQRQFLIAELKKCGRRVRSGTIEIGTEVDSDEDEPRTATRPSVPSWATPTNGGGSGSGD